MGEYDRADRSSAVMTPDADQALTRDRVLKILVVDDRPENLLATSAAISNLKQRIVTSSSGEDALRTLLSHDIDIILLDVRMPGLDGFETARLIRLKKKYESVPILFLTADTSPDSVARGYAVGAADYIRKPIDANDLRARVGAFVSALRLVRGQESAPVVLLASDQPGDLLASQCALAGLPAKVVLARNEAELRGKLAEQSYAAVLLGTLAGSEPENVSVRLSDQLRRQAAPVLLVSRSKVNGSSLTRAGAVDCIVAPLEPHMLRAKIWPYLELYRRAECIKVQERRLRQLERERAASDLLASEERFSSLVGAINELVYTLDTEQRFTAFFGGAAGVPFDRVAWLGITPQEAWGPTCAEDHETAQRGVLSGEPAAYEWSLDTGSNHRYFQTSLVPLRDERGQIKGCIGVAREVSEQKLLQLKLMQSDRLASIGMLAAGVAHEINNPLTAVLGYLQLMEGRVARLRASEAIPEEATNQLQHDLGQALRGVDRVTSVISDLRLFSRQTGAQESPHPTDINSVLDSTLSLVANEIRHRAELVKDYAQLPLAQASEGRLGQVFLNLLVNAIQAIPEGHTDANQIHVSTWIEGEFVVTQVRDTGQGMTPAVLKKLFTPFFSTKPRGVGTGLGLSICRQLVMGYGGDITVESTEGKGTSVQVTLPRARADLQGEPEVQTRSGASGGHVLVVDDEVSLVELIERALGEEHQVTSTTSARSALSMLVGGERFDVILCDVMMPELSGVEFYRAVEREAPEQLSHIVFMTGGAFSPEVHEELETLPNRRIQKPMALDALREVVAEQLELMR